MGMDVVDKVNAQMDAFYKDTGIWPPGRSMPAAFCGDEDKTMIRHRAYESWLKQTSEVTRLEATLTELLHDFAFEMPNHVHRPDCETYCPAYKIEKALKGGCNAKTNRTQKNK